MSQLEIVPLEGPVQSVISIPGSKSYTNRALIMAALTKGPVFLKNPLLSDDTEAMIGCLQTLGLEIEVSRDQIVIQNNFDAIEAKNYRLFARDSGTTVRFILALACVVPGVKTILGNPRLNERPIQDLVDALRDLGAEIAYCGEEGKLPVKVTSSKLTEHSVRLRGDVSSQFLSAILLVSPFVARGLRVEITGRLISRPYIDMTIACMRDWGVDVLAEAGNYFVPAHQSYQKKEYAIEGDYSSAGYFFAIAVLTKSKITLENLNPKSAQADRKFLKLLEEMGNLVTEEKTAVCIEGKRLVPVHVDMEDCPDQVMTMAVLAAFANGVSQIKGVRSLRVKETERVLALKNELYKMGIKTEDTDDTLTIYGGNPHGAEIDTYNDHRIAMSFAVAGMLLPGVIIRHPEVVNKTFPTFWKMLERLR